MKHAPYTHEHPTLRVALRTRTRLLGTLNLAIALRGRSCGWGTCERPRRTFVGHHRINRTSGHRLVELVVERGTSTTVIPIIKRRLMSGGSKPGGTP